MVLRLNVVGRADLDGTHSIVLETNLPESEAFFNQTSKFHRFVRLENKKRICGCIISEIKHGNANKIWIDRFKQRLLQIRDGDDVEIQEIEFPNAKKVELQVPSDFSEDDINKFIGKPIISGEKTALYTYTGTSRPFIFKDVTPADISIITNETVIKISDVKISDGDLNNFPVTYTSIGGLKREITLIREVVEYPFRFPEVFERLGVLPPKGIILYGPPGTGKTLVARALATEVNAKFYQISGPEVFSMWYGESEKRLREIFGEAQNNAPSVILIDELDSLAPKREGSNGELERRIVTSLLTAMDGLKQMKRVVVVGTTNRINSIDDALRSRFAHEIHVGVPDLGGRREILKIHTEKMPKATDINLDAIAEKTVGYVGRDIANLCREAAYNTLRKHFPQSGFEKDQIFSTENLEVSQTDFIGALSSIAPSAMREFLIEIPNIGWEDIGGLNEIKQLLVENISYAITKPEIFKKIGIKPAKGILLYGPPGTGKTLLAKAVASQCGANFITIKGPEIRSKWIGDAEERIRFIFARAREVVPCVLFFDEIDAIAPARGSDTGGSTDSIVNQLLSEMDGMQSTDGVFVIGATNRAELLDPAILRPGRFDYQLEIPLPNDEARRAILQVHLKGKPLSDAFDTVIDALTDQTDGFSGAEIAEVCREAAWEAIRQGNFKVDKINITLNDFEISVKKIKETRDKLNPKHIGFQFPKKDIK